MSLMLSWSSSPFTLLLGNHLFCIFRIICHSWVVMVVGCNLIWSMLERAEKWGVKSLFSEMEPEVEYQAKRVINHAFESRSNEQEMA